MDDLGFHFADPRVSARGREELLTAYPILEREGMMGLCAWLVYGHHKDRRDKTRKVVSRDTLQQVTGIPAFRFRAWNLLDLWSNNVYHLDIATYNHHKGEARSVQGAVDETFAAIFGRDEKYRRDNPDTPLVYLVSGLAVTTRRQKQMLDDYKAIAEQQVLLLSEDHPVRPFLEFLRTQPPHKLNALLKANRGLIECELSIMPTGTPQERSRRAYAERLVGQIDTMQRVAYSMSKYSPRMYAMGRTIHMLPRELRKAALEGCVEIDLKAAQLAIAAKLWGMDRLMDFLGGGGDIWAHFASVVGMETADCKDALKKATYSVLYNMPVDGLREMIAKGPKESPELALGYDAAEDWLGCEIVREMLTVRNQAVVRVGQGTRCIVDAWGRVYEMTDDPLTDVANALSYEIQSWEMRLMMAAYPALLTFRDEVRLMSFLHDGMTLDFIKPNHAERQLKLITDAITAEIHEHGFPTRLEVTMLESRFQGF